ncbi:MAG: hypothetical protein JSV78_12960 [Phycisphaerales bacterium]|nr:MAG: hypothetical protein JSV78_12960 [Phycisphaerales bacterium]
MAKQLVGPVERHVDKAVLGVAGLVLIGVVVKFFVSTPNQIELGREVVTPSNIDEVVQAKAKEIQERIRDAEPLEQQDYERRYPEFENVLDTFEFASLVKELPMAWKIGPEVPLVGPPKVVEGYIKLVDVVKLPKPIVKAGRSTIELIPADAEVDDETMYAAYQLPVNWTIVSSVFDIKEQRRRQADRYLKREEVYLGAIEVQRRTMRDDGTWSDEDWELLVGPVSDDSPPPAPPEVVLVKKEGNWVCTSDSFMDVESYFERLKYGPTQLSMMRPLLPPIINGDSWTMPIISSRRDVLLQDDELLYPQELPADNPEDRYPDAVAQEAPVEDEGEELTGQERVRQQLKEAEELLDRAQKDLSPDLAVQASNILVSIIQHPDTGPADRQKAQRLHAYAVQVERDIDRERKRGIRERGGLAGGEEQKPTREFLPAQQLWVHDARPNSVEGGKTYQYRMRVLIANRYAGLPKKLEDPLDAAEVLIAGEWSEPSVPVYIEPERQFFATNVTTDRDNRVKVEIYQWFEGVTVKTSDYFRVGERLYEKARADVPLPEEPEGYENALVEFEADALVLDIAPNRSYRERREGPGGSGTRFQPSREKTVAFVDSRGYVFERIVTTDQLNPLLREIKKRVWKRPRVGPSKEAGPIAPQQGQDRDTRKPRPRPPRPPRRGEGP